MEACIYKKYGKPSVLQWVDDWPNPQCDSDSVIIEVAATSVNPKDALLRRGKFSRTLVRDPLPRGTGHDLSGTVIEVGDNVSQFSTGDTVFGMTNNFSGGVLCRYARLMDSEIAKVPASIPLNEAASIPLAAQTALQALRGIAGITRGHKVLITGASGGVGHFAIQIAKALGAEAHGICSTENTGFVVELGADRVYDYKHQKPSEIDDQYDLVFDAAGRYQRKYFRSQLTGKGIFISTVPSGISILSELLARLGINKKSRLVVVRSSRQDLEQLASWVDSKKLTPHIQQVYGHKDIQQAHTQIQSGHTRGKVIVAMGSANAG